MNFYVLKTRVTRTSADSEFTDIEVTPPGPAPQCPACGGYIGLLTWQPPFQVEVQAWGKAFGDIVGGTGFDIIVSQRFRDLYYHEKLTGLTGFEPVEVVRVKRRRRFEGDPPPYFKIDVVYAEATIDDALSGMIRQKGPICPTCRESGGIRAFERLMLEEGTWKGEDLFRPRGSRSDVMASEHFKEFCERNAIANALLIPAEEYRIDFYDELGDKIQRN